jgi:DNA-binding protein YbaB
MTDHRAEVEELLADYRRSREQLASVHRNLATFTASASSSDGLITATVASNGVLVDLEFHDVAYKNYRPERLASLIVEAATAAAAKAATRANDVVSPVLPAETDPEALLRGTADLAPSELRPPVVEDSYENRTWMEPGGAIR